MSFSDEKQPLLVSSLKSYDSINNQIKTSTSSLSSNSSENNKHHNVAQCSNSSTQFPIPTIMSQLEPSLSETMMATLKGFRIHPIASQVVGYSLLPVLIWGILLLIVGKDDLPGGKIFLLVLLECGGRVLGYLVGLMHIPPMVAMLGLGIAARNIAALDLTEHWDPALSSPIRQIALAVILTRAGFGLDLNTLIKFKWLVLRLAVLPTVLEAMSVALCTHFILDFPWIWGILVGFVVAAVSPAVIVPRILELKAAGYGEKKGVPTVILASASLDNVVAISLFGVALGFIFSSKGTAEMVLQCPIEVVAGGGFGIAWGLFNAFIFNPGGEEPNPDDSVVKGIFILGGGIVSVFGFKLVNYSGAGALGCIVSAFVTISVWKKREFHDNEITQLKWGFTFLWKLFEPLLFGVIGCQIVISELDGHTVLLSVACLIVGAVVRFGVTYSTVCLAGLSTKEKLFMSLAWIPKATVQAAIGPMALDSVKNMSTPDSEMEKMATQVLTIAVVVILLTAPIGEFAVMFSGPRLLSKDDGTTDNTSQPGSLSRSNGQQHVDP